MLFKNSADQNGIAAICSLRRVLVHSERKLLYFVENVEKPGRFFMQKAAAKMLKPLDKYNRGGGYNESEQRFALRPEGRKSERGKTSKTMWRF